MISVIIISDKDYLAKLKTSIEWYKEYTVCFPSEYAFRLGTSNTPFSHHKHNEFVFTTKGERPLELMVMGVLITEHEEDEWESRVIYTCENKAIYMHHDDDKFSKVANDFEELYNAGITFPSAKTWRRMTYNELVRVESVF